MATEEEIGIALQRLDKSIEHASACFEGVIAKVEDQHSTIEAQVRSFRRAVAGIPDAAGDTQADVYAAMEDRFVKIRDILPDEDDGKVITDGAQLALETLEKELELLSQSIENEIDLIISSFGEGQEMVTNGFAQWGEFVEINLSDAFSDTLGELLERLTQSVGKLPNEVLEEIESQFDNALSDLKNIANEIADRSMQEVDDLQQELITAVEARGKELFTDEVREIGETVISSTMNEIFEDIMLTQISAQVTGMLSAQLPQLVVAKNVVGAVKRGLELLRAGF